MASPNKNPEYEAKLPRYGHDLSFDFGFTASTGMLLPIVHDFLNPGEKITASANIFTQLQFPMAVPAQIDMEQIVDYFFVPMPMLYQPFESMLYQTNDYLSSALAGFRGNQSTQDLNRSRVENFPLWTFYEADEPAQGLTSLQNHIADYSWGSVFSKTGLEYESIGRQAYRLLDMVGFNPDAVVPPFFDTDGNIYTPLTDNQPSVFPYALLAYQCVYQYFYRIDMWERFNNMDFNWDYFFGTTNVVNANAMRCLQLHYRPKYLDYFTNVKPSPYLQGRNMLLNGSTFDNSANVLVDFEKYLSESDSLIYNPSGIASTIDSSTEVYSDSNLVSSQALRNLRAADKFLQISARAANRYDDQVLAHLGYKVPNDVKHNIKYLGTQRSPFKINQVLATDAANLGEKGGQAYGSVNDKGISYTAPCHGVFIGIYSTMVKPRYIAGFDRCNVMTSIHDVWQHEYDNLGMQPIFGYELYRESSGRFALQNNQSIAGWQWRYEEKKRKYSKVSSAFRKYMPWAVVDTGDDSYSLVTPSSASENPLSAYFNVVQPLYMPFQYNGLTMRDGTISNDYFGSRASTAKPAEGHPEMFDWYSLLTPPTQLNNVLEVMYQDWWDVESFAKNPSLIYQTDPFIVDLHMNYKKVSPMSVHSMPSIGE